MKESLFNDLNIFMIAWAQYLRSPGRTLGISLSFPSMRRQSSSESNTFEKNNLFVFLCFRTAIIPVVNKLVCDSFSNIVLPPESACTANVCCNSSSSKNPLYSRKSECRMIKKLVYLFLSLLLCHVRFVQSSELSPLFTSWLRLIKSLKRTLCYDKCLSDTLSRNGGVGGNSAALVFLVPNSLLHSRLW